MLTILTLHDISKLTCPFWLYLGTTGYFNSKLLTKVSSETPYRQLNGVLNKVQNSLFGFNMTSMVVSQ